jgi:hypothetical protein
MNKYLVLLLLTCSTTQAFWCWRNKKDSPKIAPQPTPTGVLYIATQASAIINDTKPFNAAKAALKLSKLDAAFEHLSSFTDQHKKELLTLFFLFYKNPKNAAVGNAQLLEIAQACKANQEIELTEGWKKYLREKALFAG